MTTHSDASEKDPNNWRFVIGLEKVWFINLSDSLENFSLSRRSPKVIETAAKLRATELTEAEVQNLYRGEA